MINIPKWLLDTQSKADKIRHGDLEIVVNRGVGKTNYVIFTSENTIPPKSNPEAFNDLEKLINSMISASFTGKLEFALDFKEGTIKLITIKNKEIKKYGR